MPSPRFSRREFLQTAATGTVAKASGSSSRPNILFLMADEHRHDALGCAGNGIVKTPHLDGLAAQGVNFSHTYCQGPLCQPSRASIMTGQYVHQHGQTWNRTDMDPAWPTMMKALQKAGYTTAKVGKAHFQGEGIMRTLAGNGPKDLRDTAEMGRRFGLDYLLEEYDKVVHRIPGVMTPYTEYLRKKDLLDVYRADLPTGRLMGYRGKTGKIAEEDFQTSFVADRAIEWLRGAKQDKPYFLWVSFIEPHPPVIDTATWAGRYKDGRIPLGPLTPPDLPDNAWGRYLRTWMQSTGTTNMTPEDAENMARHYYGMVSLVDQRIGDILRTLRETGQDKNTWIIYTADHGEMLGQHRMVYKNVFYRGSVRVPNIVRPPGGMTGRTVDDLVQSIDLTATMMDVAGASLPLCKGNSLVPFTKGQGKPREVAYSELAGHQGKGNFFVMAATRKYRYLYDKENDLACELFDLEKDPDEMHNLVNEPGAGGIRKDMHKDYVLPFMNS